MAMGEEMRRLDDIVYELDQRRRAEAITEGILGGGHYDSDPSPDDEEPPRWEGGPPDDRPARP
jgi:hypothetical protein